MTQEEMLNIIEVNSKIELDILKNKGKEYSRSNDALANFKRLSLELGIPIEKVWCIFFMKHVDSIVSFVNLGKEVSDEKITGRIHDARNYLGILYAILEEKNSDLNFKRINHYLNN